MHSDLLILYLIAIGTLLLSAAMTLWEGQTRSHRNKELRVLAGGYVALAIGCAVATGRSHLPGAFIPALTNIIMVGGYLLILNGVAALSGHTHRALTFGVLIAVALLWAIGAAPWQDSLWSYIGAFPIAVVSGVTAWEMLRSDQFRFLRARRIVVAVAAGHAALYAARAFILPAMANTFGPTIVSAAAKVTMYEGVLYSVALPMALLALLREEAHEQLLKASCTDYLTGLGNRRWFFKEGARLIQTNSKDQPVTLLAFDLDHFKAVNDQHGHAIGDEVLKLFARVVQSATGPEAVLARIGGEEFVALLPGRDRGQARDTAQAVAGCFAETAANGVDGNSFRTTVSIGLAELGQDGTCLNGLLTAADRALYKAKACGRNRIECASSISLAAVG